MYVKKRLWLHKLLTYCINPRELTGTKNLSLQQDGLSASGPFSRNQA